MKLLEITRRQAGSGGIPSLAARYVITGTLVLDSTAHFGGGEMGDTVDMLLLRDPVDGSVFLPGSSLAGALRSFAADCLLGYEVTEFPENTPKIDPLFGGIRSEPEGNKSPLSVFDCRLLEQPIIEIRDGVAISPGTGTAEEGHKFDIEVLPRGTRFSLHLELNVPAGEAEAGMLSVLTVILQGLEQGEIPLGSRRTRGFGKCHAENWRVKRFDLNTRSGWLEWLATLPDANGPNLTEPARTSFTAALQATAPKVKIYTPDDRRQRMLVDLELRFPGGLLVRSNGATPEAADVSHIFSAGEALLPGTSLAGVLRARASRIARLVRNELGDAEYWVNAVFGPRVQDSDDAGHGASKEIHLRASQLRVSEGIITGGTLLRVNRIKIDRFTGGVVDTGLFDEEPLYDSETEVHLELRRRKNENDGEFQAKMGLVLLAIKDLITGDLNVGGSGAVGRGITKGKATVACDEHSKNRPYLIDSQNHADTATVTALNSLATAFTRAAAHCSISNGGDSSGNH